MIEQVQEFSRRRFLMLGAVGAVLASPFRRLLDTGNQSQKLDPQLDWATYYYSLTGGWRPGGFRVTAQLDKDADAGKSVRLAVSDDSGMSNILATVGPVTIDTLGLARFNVTGLTTHNQPTKYYCRLKEPSSSNLFGDLFNGWTRPADGEHDYSFDIVLGSCLANPGFVGQFGSQAALADAADLAAPIVLHLGDWGYWGQHIDGQSTGGLPVDDLAKYINTMQASELTELRRLAAGSNIEACISDHELHANGDVWDPDNDVHDAHGCEHSKRQMNAHRRLFPVGAWGDATPLPAVHRGYFIDLAPHVRLVVSDFRSPQRNESTDGDHDQDPYKQMWGATQEAWLYDRGGAFDVDEHTVILFVNETVWWRRAEGDTTDDKPASYPKAQDTFIARLNGTGDYDWATPIIDRFVWLGGDRHYCGYLSRTDPLNDDGFPQFIGSGFCKNSLKPHGNENMSWRTPVLVEDDHDAWFPVCGYMKLTLEYTASSRTVTLGGISRIVASTHRTVHDASLTDGQKTVQSQDAHFGSDDIGRLISGHHVRENDSGEEFLEDNGHTYITSVDPDNNTAEMSKTADGTGNSVTLSIASNPSNWQITDYPSPTLGPWTESFQV